MARIQVVSQVSLTSIGFDEPRLHVDIDMRISGSLGDWLQRRGRVGRAWPPVIGDRDYQQRGMTDMRQELAAKRNPLYVLPCGGGKSFIACLVAQGASNKGKAAGFLTVRRVLVSDISDRLTKFGVPHGVVMAGYTDNAHRTKVASVHTMASRGITLDCDVLFVDEGHQYVTGEFRAVLDRHAHIPRVVLTATPWRADGLGLGSIADSMVLGPSPQELIDRGFLVPTKIWSRHVPDRSKMTQNASGEYNERENEAVMSKPMLIGNCVKEWLYRANNLPTIVHAVNIKHSQSIVARFRSAGVNAVHVDADTPDEERKRVFDDMCRDSPSKKHSLLIDLAGNCMQFGFPEDDREWTLADSECASSKPRDNALSLRRCEDCFAVFRSHVDTCPECGKPKIATARQIKERNEALVELQRERKAAAIAKYVARSDDEMKIKKMAEWLKIAQDKGYKRGFAFGRYMGLYKEKPTPEIIRAAYGMLKS